MHGQHGGDGVSATSKMSIAIGFESRYERYEFPAI